MGRADKVHLQEGEELAYEVRKYPGLYDKASEHYKDKRKVANTWKRQSPTRGQVRRRRSIRRRER